MELTKQDNLIAKGVAIIGMIMLHLFCRLGELPYDPLIWIGEVPLIYYLGLFGDFCVPIYCFCSGYAHFYLKDKDGIDYIKHIPKKIFSFLCNYWIIVIIFTLIGIIVGDNEIPGSAFAFLGNMFLFKLSYNGAWWFVITYIILLLLSPIFIYIIRKIPNILVVVLSLLLYFIAYIFRFNYILEIDNCVINWIWQQAILLGTSQFAYVIGMICFNNKLISRLRSITETFTPIRKYMMIIILPVVAFIGHSIVQSLFVAPFTATIVLMSLFVAKLPKAISTILLFLGQHSTNIWFIHMFFYLTLFEGLVFMAKYPVLIVLLMFVICIPCSIVINKFYMRVKNRLNL